MPKMAINDYLGRKKSENMMSSQGREKFLIRDEEVWMGSENILAVYLFHERQRHSILRKSKVRETQGANENMQVIEELKRRLLLERGEKK